MTGQNTDRRGPRLYVSSVRMRPEDGNIVRISRSDGKPGMVELHDCQTGAWLGRFTAATIPSNLSAFRKHDYSLGGHNLKADPSLAYIEEVRDFVNAIANESL